MFYGYNLFGVFEGIGQFNMSITNALEAQHIFQKFMWVGLWAVERIFFQNRLWRVFSC